MRLNGPVGGPLLILAHGAGAGSDSVFLEALAEELGEQGVRVLRFDFSYLRRAREEKRKRPPDRMPKLVDEFCQMLRECSASRGAADQIFIGGKSMGGRVASLLVSQGSACDNLSGTSGSEGATSGGMFPEEMVSGVIAFGYPFHPPGRPDRWRTDHFPEISCPLLILQGTRDRFGTPEAIQSRPELTQTRIHWLDSGDHDFKPLARTRRTQSELIKEAAQVAAKFIHERNA